MRRIFRHITFFSLTLLIIECLDEVVFGVREAAWPLIRDDLHLDYTQIGFLLGLPNLASNAIEPVLGILGDVWKRRVIVLGGGIFFGLALVLTGVSTGFWLLLASFVMLYPASGAFVGLSQATLMDADPTRHEQNMARWTFAGSLGVVGGTLALSASAGLGWGWRWLFFALAGLTAAILVLAWRFPFPISRDDDEESPGFSGGVRNALLALKRAEVIRWLALLQFSNLMLDVLLGYLALYFVDVVHVTPETAAIAVTIWTVVGLIGDFLLIPLLERVAGLSYLRVSAALELVLFAAFLLSTEVWLKFALLALLGLFNAGWYAILQGRLYTSMPGQSGTVMTLGNIFDVAGGLLPLAFGFLAEQAGLNAVMWLLLAGPVALLVGIPWGKERKT